MSSSRADPMLGLNILQGPTLQESQEMVKTLGLMTNVRDNHL